VGASVNLQMSFLVGKPLVEVWCFSIGQNISILCLVNYEGDTAFGRSFFTGR
jgi:hypothetical protein